VPRSGRGKAGPAWRNTTESSSAGSTPTAAPTTPPSSTTAAGGWPTPGFPAHTDGCRQLLRWLGRKAAPRTLGLLAIGGEHAGQLLTTAGDNPERLRGEAAFAHLCGAAPIPAASGRTRRHRLHRGGDRNANCALHLAVVVRMRHCPRTRADVERRTKEGPSKPEIMRCLKRYLAREVYHAILADLAALQAT
jgi:Transposase IS116/IS110/IS902 family